MCTVQQSRSERWGCLFVGLLITCLRWEEGGEEILNLTQGLCLPGGCPGAVSSSPVTPRWQCLLEPWRLQEPPIGRGREGDAIENDNRSNKYSYTGQCVYQRGICIQYTRHKWLLWVATEHPCPVHRTSAPCPQTSVLCLQNVGISSVVHLWNNLWKHVLACRGRHPTIPKTLTVVAEKESQWFPRQSTSSLFHM